MFCTPVLFSHHIDHRWWNIFSASCFSDCSNTPLPPSESSRYEPYIFTRSLSSRHHVETSVYNPFFPGAIYSPTVYGNTQDFGWGVKWVGRVWPMWWICDGQEWRFLRGPGKDCTQMIAKTMVVELVNKVGAVRGQSEPRYMLYGAFTTETKHINHRSGVRIKHNKTKEKTDGENRNGSLLDGETEVRCTKQGSKCHLLPTKCIISVWNQWNLLCRHQTISMILCKTFLLSDDTSKITNS